MRRKAKRQATRAATRAARAATQAATETHLRRLQAVMLAFYEAELLRLQQETGHTVAQVDGDASGLL